MCYINTIKFVARGQGEEIEETTTELEKTKTAQVKSLNIALKFMGEFCWNKLKMLKVSFVKINLMLTL